MEKTIFSKIVNREIPSDIIYEDEHHLAFLDITPFEKGHTLVIPKKPYETIFDMPENEYNSLLIVVRKVAQNLKDKLGCDINLWQNNGEFSGQEVPHVHFHVVPRRERKKTYARDNDESYLGGEAGNYAKALYFN